MAYKMTNSPLQMWPWSKKARRKREERRNMRNIEKGTEYNEEDGKTYTREGYEVSDGNVVKISNKEQKIIDDIADQEYRDELAKLTDEELEAMRNQ